MCVATGGEPSFHLLGFCLEVGATTSRALKAVVQVLACPGSFLSAIVVLLLLPLHLAGLRWQTLLAHASCSK